MKMRTFLPYAYALAYLAGGTWALAQNNNGSGSGGGNTEAIEAVQKKIDKYVETRQLISQEEADWEVEQEHLEQTRAMLEGERERLGQRITDLQQNLSEIQETIAELEEEKAQLKEASDLVEEKVVGLEGRMRTLSNFFPESFRNDLSLLARLPEDSTDTEIALGQRMLTILGIMKRAEEYHNGIHLEGETRAVGEDGNRRQVWTLYWGLAGAFYVDSQGEFAGTGHPTAEGWEWTGDDSIAGPVDQLVRMQRGEAAQPGFVQVPVVIR